ncbi:universal stress protein [uncultured Tateyamaria sp.]|uniref:universal stress protein n=1 Tax=uncultured Tateyamaria sp. TaxID=455651 RepID=UPI0026294BA8|nr:universal stress protein [uncultured Tateyamaria sp.]
MFKRILIPVDAGVQDDMQKLLSSALELTEGWNCTCHVVTVIPDVGMPIVGSYMSKDFVDEARSAVATQLADAVASSGLVAEHKVLKGTVYDSVITYADQIDADLIIIGAHQPELRDYLLGSNAARVVRHSKRSVLVLRD